MHSLHKYNTISKSQKIYQFNTRTSEEILTTEKKAHCYPNSNSKLVIDFLIDYEMIY